MCFTVAIDLVRDELAKEYGVSFPAELPFEPAYYFSAFDHPALPVITSEDPGRVVLSRWGLVPRWVGSATQAREIRDKTINARSETIGQKPSFRHLTGRQHCLLPVTGFYEWHDHHGRRIPFYLYPREGRSLALAGLYDRWTDRATGEMWHTFTLLTVPAGPLLARIHNTRRRMPLILSPQTGREWLETGTHGTGRPEKMALLPEEKLAFHPLAPGLKKAAADPRNPALVRPWDYGFDPLEEGLWGER